MKLTKAFLTAFLGTATLCASAQGYYDDDIYYDASKDTKAKQEIAAHKKAVEEERIRQQQEYEAEMAYWRSLANQQNTYNPNLGGGDYAAADTYALPGTGSARNVDEYNRRGSASTQTASKAGSSVADDDFTYTRRIERFHNGDIIASANDPELVDYYYSSASSRPDINIYLVNPGWNSWGWGPSWYDPWWPSSPYWAWNYWGPSWSFRWNSWWGPSWSWGWGGPGWGPAWGPAWGPGWGGVAWRPGNYAPNGRRSTGIRNGYTGLGSSHPGSPFNYGVGNNSGNRGRGGSGLTRQSLGNYRPGSSSSGSRPAGNQGSMGNYRPGSSSAPSYTPSHNSGSGNHNSGSYRSNRGSSRSSSPSYSAPSQGRSSSGWGGGASRGGGSHGGGGRGGRR